MPEENPSPFPPLAGLFERGHKIHGHWNSRLEQISLGGLLLLRQEMEQLADYYCAEDLVLHIPNLDDPVKIPLVEQVFRSKYRFEFSRTAPPTSCWPPARLMKHAFFSYQFFDRVTAIHLQTGQKPILRWSDPCCAEAAFVRQVFNGQIFAIHLKNVVGQSNLDSNANMQSWHEFFEEHARPGKTEFILLGNDAGSDAVQLIPGVHSAKSMNIPLSVQLSLVQLCNGFLGMASGVCPAAILSDTPYVLFKHPEHHVAEMQRELGAKDHFCFAHARQKVWRVHDSPANLSRAFTTLSDR